VGDEQADHHGERNRQQYGDHGARAAQEDQDHHPSKHQSNKGFRETLVIASLTKTDWSNTTAVFQRCRNVDQMLDGGFMPSTMLMVLLSPALLEDRHVDGALSVDAHDVVLQSAGIYRLADIAHQNRSELPTT
jgi:hypothetical protein